MTLERLAQWAATFMLEVLTTGMNFIIRDGININNKIIMNGELTWFVAWISSSILCDLLRYDR